MLQPLLSLEGVAPAVSAAQDAIAAVHRHRANRRDFAVTSLEALMRASRASAAVDGADVDVQQPDGLLTASLKIHELLNPDVVETTAATWQRSPLQVMASMHRIAAGAVASHEGQEPGSDVGRPGPGTVGDEHIVSHRLQLLSSIITDRGDLPGPVLAAVVHGELASLQPFGSCDGIIARACSRLVCVSTGLDPRNLSVPEVGWYRFPAKYHEAVAGFATGQPEAVGQWIVMCCQAWEKGATEALSIADAFQR